MHPPTPVVPGYSIKSMIGQGGTATVYLATQQALQRDVALKILNPSALAAPGYSERFLREAQATGLVSDHPHIVTVHDFAKHGDVYYIAMQYLSGKTLNDLIASHSAIDCPEKIIEQLAMALSYVHNKGFVHRDIKPGNILFSERGDAILSDFGVAKTTNHTTQLTCHGTVIGTAKYMSPEQCRGNPEIDLRSDLYSLGIVFYQMLTSYPPYDSSDPMALMLKHISDPIPTLPERFAEYQPLINKLMAKQPEHRYSSAGELLAALETHLSKPQQKLHSRYAEIQSTPSESRLVSTETSRLKVLGVATTIIVLVIGTLTFMHTVTSSPMPDQSLRCPTLTAEDTVRRDTFIDLAKAHQLIGRLNHPLGANALEAYLLALEIDPCNTDTIKQVENIRRTVSHNQ